MLRLRRGVVPAVGLLLMVTLRPTTTAQTSAIRGHVILPREIAAAPRRPDVSGLGMPSPRSATARRQSVVYLEVGPREAFEGATGSRATIDQRGETFVPHIVAVKAGTEVDFPNNDETYHNVFSLSPVGAFDLGRYAAGRSQSVRFDRPGIVRVFCDIHSHMSAFVLVFGHRFYAVTDVDGSYRIDGVPPGGYTVTAWHERFGTVSQSVQIPEDGGDTDLELSFPTG